MGIIQRIKNIFNKNIECGSLIDDHIVLPYKNKKYLYIGKNMIVRDNNLCVVVYKYRICDIISPGKYKINADIIPETYDRAKIEKKHNLGKGVKKIKVDLYFINMANFKNFHFLAQTPLKIKSHETGLIKGKIQGECTLQTFDGYKLIKNLVERFGSPNIAKIEKEISIWIGNIVSKKIQKLKIDATTLLSNPANIEPLLNSEVVDAFDKFGLYVKNIKLKALDMSKKYKTRVSNYIATYGRVISRAKIMGNTSSVAKDVCLVTNKPSISSNSSIMQKRISSPNIDVFKKCNRCGFKNKKESKICNNCGFKFND